MAAEAEEARADSSRERDQLCRTVGWEMRGVWDAGSVGCGECGMRGVWDAAGSVGCGECGTQDLSSDVWGRGGQGAA